MQPHIVIGFLAATTVLLLTPGPIMALVIGNTLAGGRRVGLRTVLGIGLGEVLLISALGFTFHASSTKIAQLLPWLALLSALYLLWLAGCTAVSLQTVAGGEERDGPHGPFAAGMMTAICNPAALIFYAAFFTPFIDMTGDVGAQLVLLAALYVAATLTFDLSCVFLLAGVQPRLMASRGFGLAARLCCCLVYLSTGAVALSTFVNAQ